MRERSLILASVLLCASCAEETSPRVSAGEIRVLKYHLGGSAEESAFIGLGAFTKGRPSRGKDFGPCTQYSSDHAVTVLDAGGDFEIDGPNGSLYMDEDDGTYFGAEEPGAALWASNATYSFQTDGGADVARFSGTIETPQDFVVTTPDLTSPTITIDRGSDLHFEWTPASTSSSDEMQISIGQYSNLTRTFGLDCSFEDDGSATIESSWLFDADPGMPTALLIARNRTHIQEEEFGNVYLTGSAAYDMGSDVVVVE